MPNILILCGGRGVRLRPTTDVVPKALVPIRGEPIINYVVNYFLKFDPRKIIICMGYKGEKIQTHVENTWPNLDVEYSNSGQSASMLQRLYDAKSLIGERCIVAYGDTFVNIDTNLLIEAHTEKGADITLVTAQVQSPLGLIEIDSNQRVVEFREKPFQDYFVGMFVIERKLLDNVTPEQLSKEDGVGLVDLFQSTVAKKKMATYEHKGLNITFNTHDERKSAEQEIINFYTVNNQKEPKK